MFVKSRDFVITRSKDHVTLWGEALMAQPAKFSGCSGDTMS